VELTPEWRTRKINFWGVAKSVISQLTVGQDLTKFSLPAAMLYPFSMLEMLLYRALYRLDFLYEAFEQTDPEQKFVTIIRWFLSIIEEEVWEKKPYNPILGETHRGSCTLEKYGETIFISEQVCHHPPISAFVTQNEFTKISMQGNTSFGVRFGGNSVSITTDGFLDILFGTTGEVYRFSKPVPDICMTNVVWGIRKIYWVANCDITCAQTGFSANIAFSQQELSNPIEGTILKHGKQLYKLNGLVGKTVTMSTINSEPVLETPISDKILIDHNSILDHRLKIDYPPPDEQEPSTSMKIWGETSKLIIDDDMLPADAAKVKVEQAQRRKREAYKKAGLVWKPKQFDFNEEKKIYIWNGKIKPPEIDTDEEKVLANEGVNITSGDRPKTWSNWLWRV